VVNFDTWLETNRDELQPPVCNKLMFAGQLKVMFIGGKSSNERMDYHIEQGEELFYQLQGDMVLKIVEQGKKKDVLIREGETYLLPPRVPHSPQRTAGTIGLVVERERRHTETDGLRWFVPGTVTPLWERWFYCEDLGSQLGPVIQDFNASEACRTNTPKHGDGTLLPAAQLPFPLDDTYTAPPALHLGSWLAACPAERLRAGVDLWKGKDFEVTVFKGPSTTPLRGSSQRHRSTELYIYQLEGTATITVGDQVPPYAHAQRLLPQLI
jgi:3-hydroxyanthranilate 3,4-dioxygenase